MLSREGAGSTTEGSMSNYWERWHQTRSRGRSFLAGAGALSAGAAGLALVGCGHDDDEGGRSPTTGATAGSGSSPAAGTSPTQQACSRRVGATLRYPCEGLSSGDPPTLFPV